MKKKVLVHKSIISEEGMNLYSEFKQLDKEIISLDGELDQLIKTERKLRTTLENAKERLENLNRSGVKSFDKESIKNRDKASEEYEKFVETNSDKIKYFSKDVSRLKKRVEEINTKLKDYVVIEVEEI